MKRSKSERVLMSIVFVFFMVYAISLIFPFLWCFLNSFKDRKEFIFNIWGLPKNFVLYNWVECFNLRYNGVNVLGMFGNSALFSVVCTVISIYFSSATAYAVTRYKFFGSKFFYTFALILMLVPAVGAMSANYKLYNDLKIYDTYIGIFIGSCSGFGTGFIFLYSFFKNMPWSYAEAAFIDGAGHFDVFIKIMIPMAIPAITAIGIMNAIGIWNEYFTFYMYAPSKVTIAVGLNGFVELNKYGKVGYPELFATMILAIFPAILIYALAQKLIVANMTLGGLKG